MAAEAADHGEVDPAAVVADADVLAADLLVGGDARAALDRVREHSWTTLVASDPLLDDGAWVVEALAGGDLAADWRERVADVATLVEHPAGDQPALASAAAGGAAHVLTYDPSLRSAEAAVALAGRIDVSVRSPDAFCSVFDPAALYDVAVGGEYPGPDRDPRG